MLTLFLNTKALAIFYTIKTSSWNHLHTECNLRKIFSQFLWVLVYGKSTREKISSYTIRTVMSVCDGKSNLIQSGYAGYRSFKLYPPSSTTYNGMVSYNMQLNVYGCLQNLQTARTPAEHISAESWSGLTISHITMRFRLALSSTKPQIHGFLPFFILIIYNNQWRRVRQKTKLIQQQT